MSDAGARQASAPATLVPLVLAGCAALLALVAVFTDATTRLWLDVVILGALATTAIWRATQLPLGLVSPFPAWLVGGLGYSFPTVLTLLAAGTFTAERTVSEGTIGRGSHAIVIWLVAASLGYAFAATREWRANARGAGSRDTPGDDAGALAAASWVAWGAGVAGLGAFVFLVAGFSALRDAPYGERYRMMEGQGLLLVGIQTLIAAGVVVTAIHHRSGRRGLPVAAIGSLAVLGAWTWLIESRSAVVQLLIGLVAVRQLLGKPFRTATLVLGAVTLFSLGLVFALVRGGQDAGTRLTGAQLALFNPANGEFGGVAITVGDILDAVPGTYPYRLGATVPEAIGQLAPRVLWPGRPLAPSQWYVERFYPDFADMGGAYAFSPVAEAYLNFGWTGILLGGLLVGWLLSVWERSLLDAGRASVLWVAAFASVLPWLILSTRLDLATLLKTVLVGTIGQLAAIVIAARALAWLYASRPAPVVPVRDG